MVTAHESGDEVPGFDEAVGRAVTEVVARQVATGIDIVNDGEQGKRTYASYVIERLSGFEPAGTPVRTIREFEEFPDYAEIYANLDPAGKVSAAAGVHRTDRGRRQGARWAETSATLAAAADAAGISRDRVVHVSAISVLGLSRFFLQNLHYPSREEYLAALADAMKHEYRAIVEAGFTLQIDSPDFAMRLFSSNAEMSIDEIRRRCRGRCRRSGTRRPRGWLPIRCEIHLCWGNTEAPHIHDVPLRDIIDLVAEARLRGIAVEASNPRHGHEWAVFEEFTLPEDKYLLPGVIDTTTNFVEHPELVAQRIRKYTNILGNERVVATTDCGFGTHAGRNRVVRDVAWAKLRSMVEGAELASR